MVYIVSAIETTRYNEKEKPSPILKTFLRQSQSCTPKPEPKKQKSFRLWHNRVDTL